jgi:hypothetical protein
LTRSPFNKIVDILNDGNDGSDGSDAAVGFYNQIWGSASFSFQVLL